MAKRTVIPWKGKKDSKGRMPLYLVVRHKGRRATMSLGGGVKKKHWNENRGEVRRSHPGHLHLNDLISRAQRLADVSIRTRTAQADLKLSAKAVRDEVRRSLRDESENSSKEGTLCFLDFGEKIVEEYRKNDQVGTAKVYNAALNKLKEFLRDSESKRGTLRLPFEKFDAQLLRRYRRWEREEKENAPNTVHRSLSAFRVFNNSAIREEVIPKELYPFRKLRLTREETPKRQWLRKENIGALAELNPAPGTLADLAHDIFLFQYYAWGMRIGDALFLRWDNLFFGEGRLRYQMGKTGVHLDLPFDPRAQAIAEQYRHREPAETYVFPALDRYDNLDIANNRNTSKESRTSTVNDKLSAFKEQLVEAGKLPERRQLTTHTARHSAACQMYLAWRDIYRVKRYLGHKSVKVTEKYLRSMEGLPLGDDGEWGGVL